MCPVSEQIPYGEDAYYPGRPIRQPQRYPAQIDRKQAGAPPVGSSTQTMVQGAGEEEGTQMGESFFAGNIAGIPIWMILAGVAVFLMMKK